MMWHFYEIPYIPDLELVKYQSLGEQGIDGILERHNRFLRQWQRNTVLIHTTLHFFLSYTHERPKGSRLQIFLAFSSDQTVNFESILLACMIKEKKYGRHQYLNSKSQFR